MAGCTHPTPPKKVLFSGEVGGLAEVWWKWAEICQIPSEWKKNPAVLVFVFEVGATQIRQKHDLWGLEPSKLSELTGLL